MAEANKSQLISEAELIEAINADTLVSISLGAGQPQKNVKLSTLASVVAGLIRNILNIQKTVTLAAGQILNVGVLKQSGLLVISNGARGAVFGYAPTYNSSNKTLNVLSADKDGEIVLSMNVNNTLQVYFEENTLYLKNNYSTSRSFIISLL